MRGAPPVQMACGRDAAWAWAVGVLAAMAAATSCGWAAWQAGAAAAVVWSVALAAAAAGGVLAVSLAGRLPVSRLSWDGHAWQLDGAAGRLAVMIDTGSWMLLHWRGSQGTRWLPLSPRRCGAPAHLVRAAVYAHAGEPAPRGAAVPEAHG